MSQVVFKQLGMKPYSWSLALQVHLAKKLRDAQAKGEAIPNIVLLVQHPPTFTVGRRMRGVESNDESVLKSLGAEYFEV